MCPVGIVLLSVLLTLVTGYSRVSEVFAEPEADVVLPLEVTLTRNKPICDGYEWRQNDTLLLRERNCNLTIYNNNLTRHLTYNITQNASLLLYGVTREHAGIYYVQVHNINGSSKYNNNFILYVQEPVSDPEMDITCDINGSAVILCEVQNGTDLLYNWAVNGDTVQGNNRSQLSVSGDELVLLSPGPWNVSCSVRNQVSERHSNLTTVMCPEPLSEPVLKVTCNNKDGSAVIVCSVEKGTDPKFSWVWNGKSQTGNHSNNSSVISIHAPVNGNVTCTVQNKLGTKHTQMSAFCPVPVGKPDFKISCRKESRALITCNITKGTDPEYSWSINGRKTLENTDSRWNVSGNQAEVSLPFPGNISCFVKNSIHREENHMLGVQCPGKECLQMSCLMKSVIGGIVGLIVTTVPLILGCWYTMLKPARKTKN